MNNNQNPKDGWKRKMWDIVPSKAKKQIMLLVFSSSPKINSAALDKLTQMFLKKEKIIKISKIALYA